MSDCRDEHEAAGGDGGGGGGAGGGDDDSGHSHGPPGAHICDHSCDHDDPDGDSLLQYIDTTRTKCLNARRSGVANNCFKPFSQRREPTKFIESEEDDPELILFIPFTVAVNVKSICLSGDADGSSPAQVRVFRDKQGIDFDMAHELKPAAKFQLGEDPHARVWYPLPLTKMQHVQSVTLFFPEAIGGDDVSTKLRYIGLRGSATSFKTQNKAVVGVNYEIRPKPTVNQISSGGAALT